VTSEYKLYNCGLSSHYYLHFYFRRKGGDCNNGGTTSIYKMVIM